MRRNGSERPPWPTEGRSVSRGRCPRPRRKEDIYGTLIHSRDFVSRPKGGRLSRGKVSLLVESGRTSGSGDHVPVHWCHPLHPHEARLRGNAPRLRADEGLDHLRGGALQILGAVGLLVPRTRRLAGICLALLLVAMFPGNVYAALNDVPFRGEAPTPLWLRTPIQLLFIGMVLWTSTRRHSEKVEQPQVKEPVVEHEEPSPQGAQS